MVAPESMATSDVRPVPPTLLAEKSDATAVVRPMSSRTVMVQFTTSKGSTVVVKVYVPAHESKDCVAGFTNTANVTGAVGSAMPPTNAEMLNASIGVDGATENVNEAPQSGVLSGDVASVAVVENCVDTPVVAPVLSLAKMVQVTELAVR